MNDADNVATEAVFYDFPYQPTWIMHLMRVPNICACGLALSPYMHHAI